MGKIINDDGSINQIEVDELIYELEETQRLRELEIERRQIRIDEIDQEIDSLQSGLANIKMLDIEFPPTNIIDMMMDISIMSNIEIDVNNKIDKLKKEREELSNKYTI